MIDITKKTGKFGEVFITSDDVDGGVEQLKHFRGKLINGACGGFKKLFVIEEQLNEGVVSTLHAPQNDQYDYTYSDQDPQTYKSLEEIFESFAGKGNIKQLISGQKHNVILTEEGKVFTYGVGEYGSLGHGGVLFQEIPRLILKLESRKIVQIACGEYHTLALTAESDLYAWGRGFEGQLGIQQESSATPKHINYFYEKFDAEKKCDVKKQLQYITCGSYHSMALSQQGELYIWGEAKLGQCGTGKKKQKEELPTLVQFNPEDTPVLENASVKINPINQEIGSSYKIVSISGGFGHTACITEAGELYTWGFNIKGQLGLGDRKSRFKPVKVQIDILGNQVPKFKTVKCGYNTTFVTDESGNIWSFGGGNLGFKNDNIQDLPRKITENTVNRQFTEICATQNAAVFFAPMRVMSVRPNYGPSNGGTLIGLLGTGFADTSYQSLKFVFGNYELEVPLTYDKQNDSYNCQTPKFEDVTEEVIQWPLQCELHVTLDGKNYNLCEQNFLIYSSKTSVTSIQPKCANIKGGTEMQLAINIDDETAKYLTHLTVGFQRKGSKKQPQDVMGHSAAHRKLSGEETKQHANNNNNNNNQFPHENTTKTVNPLDLDINDPELEKEDIVCVAGEYSQGQITCTIPKFENDNEQLFFNVDVSLNGQQFTGQPNSFRFYDVQIQGIQPNNVPFEGGANVLMTGLGFFDTINKKIIFKTTYGENQKGERVVDLTWDKKTRSYSFIAPPISWLVGQEDPNPEMYDSIKQNGVKIELTLNGVEWIFVSDFSYTDATIEKFRPLENHDNTITQEQWEEQIKNPFPYKDPFADVPQDDEKKKAEVQKHLDEITHQMENLFKKTGQYLQIFGKGFINGDITVQFIFDNQATSTKGYYNNDTQISVQIPDIEHVTPGIQDVKVEISFNGQQFTSNHVTFRYLAFDKNQTPQEQQKFEDDILKQLKVPPKKKK